MEIGGQEGGKGVGPGLPKRGGEWGVVGREGKLQGERGRKEAVV